MEKEKIQEKIVTLKKEIAELHGPKCEVFSRVVGYLRPVQNWNNGKRTEFGMRKTMKI